MTLFWTLLPWIVSFFTIYAMWLAGNKSYWGWVVGLGNQALWSAVIYHAELWGLLPTTIFLIIVYTRNLLKWRRDGHQRIPTS